MRNIKPLDYHEPIVMTSLHSTVAGMLRNVCGIMSVCPPTCLFVFLLYL
jgi:hypothetical protein